MTTRMIPVSQLIEDFSLYPRHAVDAAHSADIGTAYEAGNKLPPLVVDQHFRILDGFHRRRGFAHVFGPEAEIECVVEQHDSELSAFQRAAELNSGVGKKLDAQDRVRVVLRMRALGAEETLIATTLHTTEQRVAKLSIKVTQVGREAVPVKQVALRLDKTSGRRVPPAKLTKRQSEVMASSGGWGTKQTVRQLTQELAVGLFDDGDAELLAALWALHQTISEVVPQPEKAVA